MISDEVSLPQEFIDAPVDIRVCIMCVHIHELQYTVSVITARDPQASPAVILLFV